MVLLRFSKDFPDTDPNDLNDRLLGQGVMHRGLAHKQLMATVVDVGSCLEDTTGKRCFLSSGHKTPAD